MSLLGNLIWLLCGGLFSFIGYAVAGLLLCFTIVGIPFGIQVFKLGTAMLAPFGKEVREKPEANHPLRLIFNVAWLLLFGWELALSHVVWGILLCVTIVGIPFGFQHFKLVLLALLPFGRSFEAVPFPKV